MGSEAHYWLGGERPKPKVGRPQSIGAGLSAWQHGGGVVITGPCGLRHDLTHGEMREVGQWLLSNGRPDEGAT